MSQYDNNMSGALFANQNRQSDSHPNAKGSCEIDGVEYWISSWTNTSKNGQKYQSLKFQRKDQVHQQGVQQAQQAAQSPQGQNYAAAQQGQAQQAQQPSAPNPYEDFDDDIPF